MIERVAALLALMLCGDCAYGEVRDLSIDCPRQISVRESAESEYDSWSAVIEYDNRHVLRDVSVFFDHPSKGESQVPDRDEDVGQNKFVEWQLHDNGKHDFWMACSYTNTSVLMVRKIPDVYRRCRVVYSLLPTGRVSHINSVKCDVEK